MESTNIRPRRPPNSRMLQTFRLVRLDGSIAEENDDYYRSSITKLREVVNTVHSFINVDQCIDFIDNMKEEKIFIILPGFLGERTVPVIHNKPQINAIYILCGDKTRHLKWAKDWSKIKDVFTDITAMCEPLKRAAHGCDHNSIPISFIQKTDGTSVASLDRLDPSFMYTQILKEILLTLDFKQSHINDFLTHCHAKLFGDSSALQLAETLFNDYYNHQPIWWYSYSSLLYSMLNEALRSAQMDSIIKMGFFVRDLHNHIVQIHAEQYGGQNHPKSFIVYRGQGLSETDFNRLMNTPGGLMSFNSFLSTSLDQAVSKLYAESSGQYPSLIGVLFVMEVDSSISTTPFANIAAISHYHEEEEILFSMHTVFRINEMKQIDESGRLWQVNLKLTSENDPQLRAITQKIQEEIAESSAWQRLGKLMLKLGQFDKAEKIYETLLEQTTDEDEKANIFHHLGVIKDGLGQYTKAVECYKKVLEIRQKDHPPYHPDLLIAYNNIAHVYYKMGENLSAFLCFKKVLDMRQKALPDNHIQLAISYQSIGNVYEKMGEYSKALAYGEEALKISEKTLPENHPDLAISYLLIGNAHKKMGEYLKALSSYEKALVIQQKTLLADDPDLATTYNNIGNVYDSMGEYSKALSSHEKALEICKNTLPNFHPRLSTSYNNIGEVYRNMGDYPKALTNFEKALKIEENIFPENHPNLSIHYNNIGEVYSHLRNDSKALSYHEKALEIQLKTLLVAPYDLTVSYNNIGLVYSNMGEYSKALSSHEKALEIWGKIVSTAHPLFATIYYNMGYAYNKMGEYLNALSFYEKALELRQKVLRPNHPHTASCFNSIGLVYNKMGEYSKALSYHKQALEMLEKTQENHPDLGIYHSNISLVHSNMGEYLKALSSQEKAHEIFEKFLPADHLSFATSYKNTGVAYSSMGEHSKALSYYERALDIRQRSLASNHPDIEDVKEKIENARKKL